VTVDGTEGREQGRDDREYPRARPRQEHRDSRDGQHEPEERLRRRRTREGIHWTEQACVHRRCRKERQRRHKHQRDDERSHGATRSRIRDELGFANVYNTPLDNGHVTLSTADKITFK